MLPSLLSGAGSLAASFAGADPVADAERRRGLRRMKIVALAFLVGATVIFLACAWAQKGGAAPAWVGYVRAAAEAGTLEPRLDDDRILFGDLDRPGRGRSAQTLAKPSASQLFESVIAR